MVRTDGVRGLHVNINQCVGSRNAGELIIGAVTGPLLDLALKTSAAAVDLTEFAKELNWLTSGRKSKATVQFVTSDPYAQNVVPNSYYGSTHDLFAAGPDYLGVCKVLSSAEMSTRSAVSPIANLDSSTQGACTSFPPASVWNGTVVWETAVVWGTLTNEGFAGRLGKLQSCGELYRQFPEVVRSWRFATSKGVH